MYSVRAHECCAEGWLVAKDLPEPVHGLDARGAVRTSPGHYIAVLPATLDT